MSEMIELVAKRISNELSLHKQGLDWEDRDGPIWRAARLGIRELFAISLEMREAGTEALEEFDPTKARASDAVEEIFGVMIEVAAPGKEYPY